MSHSPRVPLLPMIVPGSFWRRHRHFLVPEGCHIIGDSYAVLDAPITPAIRMGDLAAWRLDNRRAYDMGVPPAWLDDPAVLPVPAPGRRRGADGMSRPSAPGMFR